MRTLGQGGGADTGAYYYNGATVAVCGTSAGRNRCATSAGRTSHAGMYSMCRPDELPNACGLTVVTGAGDAAATAVLRGKLYPIFDSGKPGGLSTSSCQPQGMHSRPATGAAWRGIEGQTVHTKYTHCMLVNPMMMAARSN